MSNVLIKGPVSPAKIAASIAHHQSKTDIGAHAIFLGQVRADEMDGKTVCAIDYTAYDDMAEAVFRQIREESFTRFNLTCMHIYHSTGLIKAGEICLFVFTSSRHRKMAMDACRFVVEAIKERVPVFGKELLDDDTHQWKINT